jgi:hypothetical protein
MVHQVLEFDVLLRDILDFNAFALQLCSADRILDVTPGVESAIILFHLRSRKLDSFSR